MAEVVMRTSRRRQATPGRIAAGLVAAALVHALLALVLATTNLVDLRFPLSSTSAVAGASAAHDESPVPLEVVTDDVSRDPERIVEALQKPDPPTLDEKKREEE